MAINKLIVLVSVLFLSLTTNADDVPNTFQAGDSIVASDVNENFTDLQNQINTLKAQLEAQTSTETPREWVGVTSTTKNGNAGGLFAMHELCAAEVQEGSRMCTTKEVVNSDSQIIFNGQAWMHSNDYIWADNYTTVIDNASGAAAMGPSGIGTNCGGWSSSSINASGWAISNNSFLSGTCSSVKNSHAVNRGI